MCATKRLAQRHRMAVSCGLTLLLISGCASPQRLVLEQPFAPAAQRVLELEPRSATIAEIGGRCVCAADFPLPGSKDGPVAFTIYVESAAKTGAKALDDARGFLIQHVGALAGKSEVVAGAANCSARLLDSATEAVALDVRFADGARLSGDLIARRDEPTVRMLQRRYRPDIAALQRSTSAVAAAAESTEQAVEERPADSGPPPTPPRAAGLGESRE